MLLLMLMASSMGWGKIEKVGGWAVYVLVESKGYVDFKQFWFH